MSNWVPVVFSAVIKRGVAGEGESASKCWSLGEALIKINDKDGNGNARKVLTLWSDE